MSLVPTTTSSTVEEDEVRQSWEYRLAVGSRELRLPLMQIAPGVAISLLMTIDEDLETMAVLGRELGARLPHGVQAVASAATLGISVGADVARSLGLSRQYVLQKTHKKHLSDALVEPLESLTTAGDQVLRLDSRWVSELDGKRVVFVDDVVSSGGSCAAALRLLRAAGARVVAIAAVLVEGDSWRTKLQEDAGLVVYLAKIPIFKRRGAGWVVDWNC